MTAQEYLANVADKYTIKDVAKEIKDLQIYSPSVRAAGEMFWVMFWKEIAKKYSENYDTKR